MSVTLIPGTRDEARGLFADSGLTYADLDEAALDALLAFLDIELARCRLDPNTPYKRSMRMCHKIPRTRGAGAGIADAFLRVKCAKFEQREAISFNGDGFIGIAGWADSKNVRPFLVAFGCWVERLSKRKEGMA